jgi:hypothetical protein
MCCLAVILFLVGPRIMGLIWWLFDPSRWDDAFGSWIWPILGLVFLPWFTVAFVLVAPTGTVSLLDATVLVLALMLDFASLFGGYLRRDEVPGYSGI